MSFQIVEIRKSLQVLVAAGLVVGHVTEESLHTRLFGPQGLLACLRAAGGGGLVFGAQFFAEKIKKLRSEFLPPVR